MLSGMSNLEQIQDNLDTFSTEAALSSEEVIFIENIAREFKTSFTIPCTACRYCCDDCPKGLALPRLLEIYNAYRYGGWWSGHELNEFEADKLPGECIGCAKCQDHCPQGIDIPGIMKEMSGLGKGK